jgi:hypothetical protein
VAKKPTVGEILKKAKANATKIRKRSTTNIPIPTKAVPPVLRPVLTGVQIADIVSRVSQELVNQAADIAFRDFQNVELPSPGKRMAKTILPEVDQILSTVPERQRPERVRSDKQLINDQIMRDGMKDANTRARKKNGQLKKGMTQKKIAKMAQLYCTKERQRLGLCDKPMKKKSTRKGQVRKTARRAYER